MVIIDIRINLFVDKCVNYRYNKVKYKSLRLTIDTDVVPFV